MGAAFDDTRGGDQSQNGFLLKLGNRQCTAVAHGVTDFAQRQRDIVLQTARIGNVGVDTFLKRELLVAAHVVTLPVAGTGRAFTPVFFIIGTADVHTVRGALVETGEISAKHDEVRTHGKRQGDMVVIDDTAVGADGNIDAGLFIIAIALGTDLNDRRGLAAADSLGLTGDADGPAANPDLDKICAAVSKEAEAGRINDITRADLDTVTVFFADPGQGELLPVCVAFGGVDAKHVGTGFYKRGLL